MTAGRVGKAVAFSVVAVFGTASIADAHEPGKQSTVSKYEGDASAKGVCMSIVYDDVKGLRKAFRKGRNYPLERSYLHYECNDLALDEFALTQNAVNVGNYLSPKFGGRHGSVSIEQIGAVTD